MFRGRAKDRPDPVRRCLWSAKDTRRLRCLSIWSCAAAGSLIRPRSSTP